MHTTPLFSPHVPGPAIQDRFRGCLLGGAIGDALGAPVEFLRQAEIVQRFGAPGITDLEPAYGRRGAITDDTQMTLFTAEGLLRAYVRSELRGLCHPPTVIAHAYRRWLITQGEATEAFPHTADGWLIQQKALFARRAPGVTCISALTENPDSGRPARNDSKGCGGVMRVAPVGMLLQALSAHSPRYRDANLAQAFELACQTAALTHGHPTGQLAAGTLAALIFLLLEGHTLARSIDAAFDLLVRQPHHEETAQAIRRARALAAQAIGPDQAIPQLGEGWVAEEALAIGIFCALRANDFEAGVVMAVNHDGDSDSTGLIAGQLLGAYHGLEALPQRWQQVLELRDVIESLADDLATAPLWRLQDYESADGRAEHEYYTARYPGH